MGGVEGQVLKRPGINKVRLHPFFDCSQRLGVRLEAKNRHFQD